MPSPFTLSSGGFEVTVSPSGSIAASFGGIAATLDEPRLSGGTSVFEPSVTRSGDSILIRTRRSAFLVDRSLSLRCGSDRCVLQVRTTLTAERTGAFVGSADRWRCSSEDPFDYRWTPNLRPGENLRAGSHCFRSPVVMLSGSSGGIAMIPDFSDDAARADAKLCALDLDASAADGVAIGFGLEPTRPTGHVYFELDPAVEAQAGMVYRFDYHLILTTEGRRDFLRTVSAFLWHHYSTPYAGLDLPQTVPYDAYAAYAYPTLVGTPPFVRFELGGRNSGGVAAEAAHKEYFRRPDPIVWNQVWFNGQRAAYGLGIFGKAKDRADWLEAGRRMTSTSLSAPDWEGLWPAIYAFDDGAWWGSIPRLNGGPRRVHVADAALTGEWLLHWVSDVEETPQAMERIRGLADRVCRLQAADGSVAPWFDFDGSQLEPDDLLRRSAETGAATAFLGEAALCPGFEWVATSVLRGAEFLASEVMPGQSYQDFETFLSCSPKDLDMVDPFTGILPQNSLAVFWTARTMLAAYRLTGRDEFLRAATEATDILSLYQQIWNPPFLNLYAFGGFGVMNTDAEWNDARQSLFAPHYFAMHEATRLDEYLARGRAALKASFVLASIPENESVSPNTFAAYPPGLMPENYGHSGGDVPAGRSDTCWGESGALTSVAWLRLHCPGLMMDLNR